MWVVTTLILERASNDNAERGMTYQHLSASCPKHLAQKELRDRRPHDRRTTNCHDSAKGEGASLANGHAEIQMDLP